MTKPLDCEAVQAELAAEALAVATERRPAEIERHLAQCDACRAFLAECLAVGDQLLFALEAVQPPAGAKARLMAELAADSAGAETDGEARAQSRQRLAAVRPAPTKSGSRLGRWWPRPAWPAAAALLGAAIMGAAGGAAWQHGRLAHLSALNRDLTAQMAERTALLATPDRAEVFAVDLSPTEQAPAAVGQAACYEVNGEFVLIIDVRNLPALSGAEAYQAWLVKDGVRTDAGIVQMAGPGSGFLLFRYSASKWFGFNAIGITREPDALGHQPRGKKVLGSPLSIQAG